MLTDTVLAEQNITGGLEDLGVVGGEVEDRVWRLQNGILPPRHLRRDADQSGVLGVLIPPGGAPAQRGQQTARTVGVTPLQFGQPRFQQSRGVRVGILDQVDQDQVVVARRHRTADLVPSECRLPLVLPRG